MKKIALLCIASALCGCITLKTATVDRKTQLENQILGSFQRLERDLILASSVRGEQNEALSSPLEREAVQAYMNREFNRDDIEKLKDDQLVGETNSGLLKVLHAKEDKAAVIENLVKEENHDRIIIMQRVIAIDPTLSDKDLPLVQSIMYKLQMQTAKNGHQVQKPNGQWQPVNRNTNTEDKK